MVQLKASTKRGLNVLGMGTRCDCHTLRELYNRFSQAKQEAYDWCYEEFRKDENSYCFRVGNANTFGFTATWLTTINGELVRRVETPKTSYLVWCER